MRIEELTKLIDAGYTKAEIIDLMREERTEDPKPADDLKPADDPKPADDSKPAEDPVADIFKQYANMMIDAAAKLTEKIEAINLFNTDFPNNPGKSDTDILSEIISPKMIEKK